jgi:putative endonuclease
MAAHNDLGEKGEDIAVQYIAVKGYQVLERNWRFGKDEVDIIATHDDTLVVVEVKTRNSAFFGSPAQFVSKAKQRHLIRAAHAYIEKQQLDLEVRFDIIGILIDARGEQIEHIEHAFLPKW